MLEQARQLLQSVSADPNAPASGPGWKSLHTLLKKAPCDQMRLARFIAERNVEAMRKLLDEVAVAPPRPPRGSFSQPAPVPAEGASAGAAAPAQTPAPRPEIIIRAEKPTPQQLKTALAAFKKRLKLTKLDQESRLNSRSPLSAGAKSGVIAILPPNLYPRTYWEELEKQGQIRNTGGGFYELVEKPKPLRGAAAAAKAKAEAPGAEGDEAPDGADHADDADEVEPASETAPGDDDALTEEGSASA